MAPFPHRIGRLTAEIAVADLDTALKLRARAEDLFWTLAPRVIARVFDAVVPADVHLSVGRLDLDLGVIPAEHLERDGLAALERALTRALAEALGRIRFSIDGEEGLVSADQASLDRLETYLTRGVTPLRPAGTPFDLDADLAQLSGRAPAALTARLRSWTGRPEVLERLVVQAGEPGLRALATALTPGETGALLACLDDLGRVSGPAGAASLGAPGLGQALWRSALTWLLRHSGVPFSRPAFLAYLRDEADDPAVILAAATLSPVRRSAIARGSASPRSPGRPPGVAALARLRAISLPEDPRPASRLTPARGTRNSAAPLDRDVNRPEAVETDAPKDGPAAADIPPGPAPERSARASRDRISADDGVDPGDAMDASGSATFHAARAGPAGPASIRSTPTSAASFPWRDGDAAIDPEPGSGRVEEPAETPLDLIRRDPAAFASRLRALAGGDRAEARAMARRLLEILPPEAILAVLGAGPPAPGRVPEDRTRSPESTTQDDAPLERRLASIDGPPQPDQTSDGPGPEDLGASDDEALDLAIARAVVNDTIPDPRPTESLGERFDRLAATRAALDEALDTDPASPASSEATRAGPMPQGLGWAELLTALPHRSWADLWLIFSDPDAARIEARLSRALTVLAPDQGAGLLARLAADVAPPDAQDPEPASPDSGLPGAGASHDRSRDSLAGVVAAQESAHAPGHPSRVPSPDHIPPGPNAAEPSASKPSAAGTSGAGPGPRIPDAGAALEPAVRRLARRWAGPAALTGTPISAIAPNGPVAPVLAQADSPHAERPATLAWLSGAGPDRAIGAGALQRLAAWTEGQDPDLDAALRRGVAEPTVRARWAAGLTDAVLARLMQRLAPDRAVRLVTLMTLISAAARLEPVSGSERVSPRLPWALALGLLASPRTTDLAAQAAALAQGLAGAGGPRAASRLLEQARRLARSGGHFGVLAALRAGLRLTDTVPAAEGAASRGRRPDAPLPTPASPAPTAPAPGEALYVANSGLVLFNPYLPALFDRLGLLTEGEDGSRRVRGLAAASRAVHLLQYLVDGRLDQPEPDLALNKALAGLVPAAPVTPRIEPSPADLALCDSLVEAVIANWPMMRGNSPEALRETFLRREGRLTREDGRWALRVQRRSLDLIVDRIPWAISVVYHRWMTDPIHVTW